MIVKAAPLIEQRRLRRIVVLCRMVGIHSSPTKANRTAPRIANGKHDTPPEAVIGGAAAVTFCGNTRIHDQLLIHTFAGQMRQSSAVGRGKPDLPSRLHLRAQAALCQIVPRLHCGTCLQLQPVPLHGLLHHFDQLCATIRLLLRLRIAFGHWHPGFTCEDFHGLHEVHVLSLSNKRNGVSFGVAAKAVIEPFPVIDVEAGGLFLMERAWRPQVALTLIRLAGIPHDLAPDHLPQRQAVTQFIKESGGQTHMVLSLIRKLTATHTF